MKKKETPMSAFTNYTEAFEKKTSNTFMFEVGDVVRLNDSRYNNQESWNPHGVDGLITQGKLMDGSDRYQVAWGNGINSGWYYRSDLIKKNMNNYNPINNVAAEILDADTKELIKAGYLNTDLSLTDHTKSKLVALLFTDKKAVLIEDAKVQNLKNETRN